MSKQTCDAIWNIFSHYINKWHGIRQTISSEYVYVKTLHIVICPNTCTPLIFGVYLVKVCLNMQRNNANCNYWLWILQKTFKCLKQMKISKDIGLHFPGKLQHFDRQALVTNCIRMLPFHISGSWNVSVKLIPEKVLGMSLNTSQKEVIHSSTFFWCIMIKTRFTWYWPNRCTYSVCEASA